MRCVRESLRQELIWKNTWKQLDKTSQSKAQKSSNLNTNMSLVCVCVCVCVCASGLQEPVYQHWLTMDLWLWDRDPLKYTWGNLHLFPGNGGRDSEPWRWIYCVCVCVMCVCVWCVCAPVWAHARTAQLPSSTCSDAPRGRKQLSTPQSQTYSDQEEHYETVRPSVLNDSPPPTLSCRADWEVPAWKTGQRWPNWVEPEAGSGALAEGWTTEAYRGLFLPECRASVCAKMNPMWKVYKSKVMKTINPEYEEDAAEEVRDLQGFAASYARIKCWEVDGGCWHPKSESQQIIFYSSRGQTSSISCSVCCAKRTFRE